MYSSFSLHSPRAMIMLLLIAAMLLVGFFTGMEIAFNNANKLGIELKKKQGKRSGILLSGFLANPSKFISTTLIGFYIFLVAYGLLITGMLAPFWKLVGISMIDQSGTLKLMLEILVSTLLILLIEFIFKAVFRVKNDWVLAWFASPMDFFYALFTPVSNVFHQTSNWILKYIFNLQVDEVRRPFIKVDLEHYFQQSLETDAEHHELNHELFENALSLPGIKVRSCLVPRPEIVALEISTSIKEVLKLMIDTKLSKIVIYEGNIDNISGYVHQLDMFKSPTSIKDILLPIPAVPESMSITDLIGKFSKNHKSIAWVVDEFGGTAGIVTMEDLLEEIFGEIRDEYDIEEFVDQQLSDTEYMFSGRLELDFLNEKYGFGLVKEELDTLSGFIIQHNETIPKQGERVIAGNYQFDIMNMTDTRIELLKMKVLG